MGRAPARIAVIGAGPMGISAALLALERGFEVTVFERGEVGESVRRWGPSTRLFSPMRMNLPARARELLGGAAPDDDALLTGPELADKALVPLACLPPLSGRVRTRHRVAAVGRAGLTRLDLPGHPLRAERPFRLLLQTPRGEEYFEAEAVLDASGVYGQPGWSGPGGLPARGERELGARLIRRLGELESRRAALIGRRALLIGHGHSAANALLLLERMAADSPQTRVVWATRSSNRRPCAEVAGDPLPERQRVAARANDLASDPPSFLSVLRGCSLQAIEAVDGGGDGASLRATLAGPASAPAREEIVHEAISLTGYRPDLGVLTELALEISPVTEGGARLSRALTGVTDCLALPRVLPKDLESGEPGFFLVGSKSYGRSPAFLLRTGLAHLETILEGLAR
ncbi:MAG TPA: FAD-dependent oxidoreductase [Candidatus Polarisedimenticolia bacterium]|jgi:hypothetical protein